MNNSTLKSLLIEYDKKRINAENIAQKEKENLINKLLPFAGKKQFIIYVIIISIVIAIIQYLKYKNRRINTKYHSKNIYLIALNMIYCSYQKEEKVWCASSVQLI